MNFIILTLLKIINMDDITYKWLYLLLILLINDFKSIVMVSVTMKMKCCEYTLWFRIHQAVNG